MTDPSTLVTSAAIAMAGAISYLFKMVMNLSKIQAHQGEQLGEFRGRQEGITQLSNDVLKTVHRAARLSRKELADLADPETEDLEE